MAPFGVVGNIMFSISGIVEGALLRELSDHSRHERLLVALGLQLQSQLTTCEIPACKLRNRSPPCGVGVSRLGLRLSGIARAPTPERTHELARA